MRGTFSTHDFAQGLVRSRRQPTWPFSINLRSPQATGLHAWWPCTNGGTVICELVRGNHFVLDVDQVSVGQEIGPGSAIQFNGVTAYASNSNSLLVGNPSFSISAWVYVAVNPAYSGIYPPLLMWGSLTAGQGVGFTPDPNVNVPPTEEAFVGFSNGGQIASGIPRGRWIHMCWTRIGGGNANVGNTLYIDTVSYSLVDHLTAGLTPAVASGPYQIGGAATLGALAYRVFDLRVYERTLSHAEVFKLWAPRSRWELYDKPNPFYGGYTTPEALPTHPQVSSAFAESSRVVRVLFSEAMTNDDELTDVANYTLTPDVDNVGRGVVSVEPEPVTYPTYVRITFDGDLSNGDDNYNIEVDTAVTDSIGTTLDTAYDDADFSVHHAALAALAYDHCEHAKNRLAWQFRKPKIEAVVCALSDRTQEVEQAFADILFFRSIETGYGVTLDNIGTLLNVRRSTAEPQKQWVAVPTDPDDSTIYRVTINGTHVDFVTDGSATQTELLDGMIAAINATVSAVSAASEGTNITITARTAGTPFTIAIAAGPTEPLELGQAYANVVRLSDEDYRVRLRAKALVIKSKGRPNELIGILQTLDNDFAPDEIALEFHPPATTVMRGVLPAGRQRAGVEFGDLLLQAKPVGTKLIFEFEEADTLMFAWAETDFDPAPPPGSGMAESPGGPGGRMAESIGSDAWRRRVR